MAFDSSTWKKIRNSADIYGGLTEENRRKFWEYGTTNGLVDFQNITPDRKQKLQDKYGVTQDTYIPKYLLKKDSEDGKAKQSAEIRKDELRYKERAAGQEFTGVVQTGDKGIAKVANQKELNDYADKIKDMSPEQLIEYKKTKKPPIPKFVQGTKTTFKPIIPYTTNPIKQNVITQTQSPTTVPTVDSRFLLANKQQNLKESTLEPQIPQTTRPLSSRLQEDFNLTRTQTKPTEKKQYAQLTPREQQIALGVIKPTEQERQAMNIKMYATPESTFAQNFFKGSSFGLTNLAGTEAEKQAKLEANKQNPTEAITGQLSGALLPQGMLYKALNKVIQGTAIGQKLLGSANLGTKIASSQGAQLLADRIILTPVEYFNGVYDDKSMSEVAKTFALNTGLDILINGFLGGIEFTPQIREALKTKPVRQQLSNVGSTPEILEEAIRSNDNRLIEQIRSNLNITPVEGEIIVKQGLESPSLLQRLRQASGINPFGDSTVKPKIQPNINQASINSANIPKIGKDTTLTANMGKSKQGTLSGEYTLVREPKPIKPTLKPVEPKKTDEELVKSFSDKISSTKSNKKGKTIKEQAFNARKQFEDDLLEFQKLEKSVKGKVGSAEESIYKTARIYKGAPEKANEFIRTELAPIIDRVVSSGVKQEDLSKYALAVHARDVNNAGIKSGMTDEEITAVIKKYGTPEIEQARKELVAVSNKAIDNLMTSGRISKESVDAMRQKWPNYMPLSRSFDDDKVDFAVGLSQAFSNVSNPIKTLKGSEREVIDPIESMVKNIYKITDSAERNKVGVQLAQLADKADDSIIRKLKSGEEIGRKNVVTVYADGKKAQYEVEPEVFKAFNNLDKESSNLLMNWLAKPASVLRAGATLTPEFALRNPFRDIQNAFVVSKSGFNPLLDFPTGLASTLKKDELYSQWLKEGGGYGNVMSADRQAHKEALQNALKQPISKKFVNVITPKGFMAMLRSISDVTESATKVGEFKAALRSGATPQEAAFRSRDLMDFARSGYSIRQANKIVAFMNASIQGKSKLIRAIKDNPTGVMTRMATSMVLPTVGIALANYKFASEEQKKTINDAPDWLKDTFWLIAVPGTDMVARFPKPFDISVVANGTERFLDYAMNKDKEAFDGFAKSTLKNMSIPIMMTGLVPTLEAMTNYSFFRQSPIISQSEQNRQKKDQYDSKTSHVGKAIASVVGNFSPDSNFASPRIIDHVLKSSTAGLGQYGMDATDFIANGLSKDKGPVKPSLRIEQAPVAKAFLVSPFTSGKSVDFVYSTKDKLTKEKSSAKFNDVEFSGSKQAILDYANEQTKMMTDISKSIKEVETSTTMTSGQKRDEIVRLTKERNKIAQDASDYIKKYSAK